MSNTEKLLEVMRRLRSECPWDREQTFATIAPYTVEEAYEVADAIAREDWADLEGELGDLLLQVVFHARIAEEAGLFDFEAVAGAICDKMERRHPHVFGTAAERARGAEQGSWEHIKARERAAGGDSALDGVAPALPALKRAQKLGKRASRVGFDWPDADGPAAKIREELTELDEAASRAARHDELGDVLFAVVNLARHLGVDAEQALTDANRRFEARFRALEQELRDNGQRPEDLGLDTLEAAWQRAKQKLR